MQDIKGTRTNCELLSVPILIMSEQFAKFETYFSYGDDVWYMEQKGSYSLE